MRSGFEGGDVVGEYIIHQIPEDEYAKAKGQFRLQLNGVFEPFRMYGQDIYIRGAIEEIVHLTEDFAIRVRGDKDKPISLDYIRRPKRDKRGRFTK